MIMSVFCYHTMQPTLAIFGSSVSHWVKADDRNCNYGHPKMADMKLGKNIYERENPI